VVGLHGALGQDGQALYVVTTAEQIIGELASAAGLRGGLGGHPRGCRVAASMSRQRAAAAGVQWATQAGAHKLGLQG
jgi:hypothetical protein